MDENSIITILVSTGLVYMFFKMYSNKKSGGSAAINDTAPNTTDFNCSPQIVFKAALRALKSDPDIKIDYLDEVNFEIGANYEQTMASWELGILISVHQDAVNENISICKVYVKEKIGFGPYINSITNKKKQDILFAIKSEILSE